MQGPAKSDEEQSTIDNGQTATLSKTARTAQRGTQLRESCVAYQKSVREGASGSQSIGASKAWRSWLGRVGCHRNGNCVETSGL